MTEEVTAEAVHEEIARVEGGGLSEKDSNKTAASTAETSAVDGDQAAMNDKTAHQDPSRQEIDAMRESPTDSQLDGLLRDEADEASILRSADDQEAANQMDDTGQHSDLPGHAEKRTNGDTEIDGIRASDSQQPSNERSLDGDRMDDGKEKSHRKPENGISAISEISQIGPTPGNAKPVSPANRPTKNREEMVLASPHAAARYGNVDALKNLISKAGPNEKDSVGFTPVHFAACYGHTEALIFLISAGGEMEMASEHGWTPLHVAARNGHVPCVNILLEAGVDVNKPDQKNWTALHNASCSPSAECVEKLLTWNAEKDRQDDDGWTPLHFAARFNNVDALEKLLKANADPNVKDVDGWTAMHNSARNGRNRCVQVLIEHKADLFAVTRYKETPLHVACRKGKAKVVEKIVMGAEQNGQLRELLAMTDLDGKKAEHVASSPFIRKTLNKEFVPGGSTYELPSNERGLRKGLSVRDVASGAAKKSSACTIV